MFLLPGVLFLQLNVYFSILFCTLGPRLVSGPCWWVGAAFPADSVITRPPSVLVTVKSTTSSEFVTVSAYQRPALLHLSNLQSTVDLVQNPDTFIFYFCLSTMRTLSSLYFPNFTNGELPVSNSMAESLSRSTSGSEKDRDWLRKRLWSQTLWVWISPLPVWPWEVFFNHSIFLWKT